MSFEIILFYCTQAVTLVILYCLVRNYRVLPNSLRNLFFLLIAFSVFQLWNVISYQMGIMMIWIYQVALIIYYVIIWKLFYDLFSFKIHRTISNFIFAGGFISIASVYFLRFDDDRLLADAVLIENLVIVAICFLYYLNMLKNVSIKPIQRQWQFFMVTGFFTYSLGSSAIWISFKVGHTIGYVNQIVSALEILLFLWAVRVFLAELKISKGKVSNL